MSDLKDVLQNKYVLVGLAIATVGLLIIIILYATGYFKLKREGFVSDPTIGLLSPSRTMHYAQRDDIYASSGAHMSYDPDRMRKKSSFDKMAISTDSDDIPVDEGEMEAPMSTGE